MYDLSSSCSTNNRMLSYKVHRDEKKKLQEELDKFVAGHDMHSAESQRLAADLQKHIDEHKFEKKRLKAELAETQAAHDEHASERARLEGHVDRLTTAHEAEKQRLVNKLVKEHEDALAGAIDSHKVQQKKLKDELAQFKLSHDMHSAENQNLAAELQKHIDEHSAEKKKLKAELAETKAAHDDHASERARLEGQVDRLSFSHAKEKERLANKLLAEHEEVLAEHIKDHSKEKKRLQEELDQFKATHDMHSAESQRLATSLQQHIDEHTEEKRKLKAELLETQVAHDEHASERVRLEGHVERLTQAHVVEKERLEKRLLEEHEDVLAKAIAEHGDEKKKLKAELEQFKAGHDMHSAESQRLAAELQKHIDEHSAEKKKLKTELAETKRAGEEDASERSKLGGSLDRTLALHEAEKDRLSGRGNGAIWSHFSRVESTSKRSESRVEESKNLPINDEDPGSISQFKFLHFTQCWIGGPVREVPGFGISFGSDLEMESSLDDVLSLCSRPRSAEKAGSGARGQARKSHWG